MSHGFVAHATPSYRAMSSGFDPPTLRVVHVDDSALLQDRMRAYFEELGHIQIVGTAEGQSDAIAALSAREYDVALIDVELRQGTGIPVIRHIREHPPRGESPLIIVFTSFALPAIRERCMSAGADYFLDKARDFERLSGLLRMHAQPDGRVKNAVI